MALLELIRPVALAHQVVRCGAPWGKVLRGRMNAETARIGQAASAVGFAIHPTRNGALAKATHAISLVLPDQRPLVLRDKDKRVVWRLESAGIAKTKPLPRTQQVTARHPEIPPFDADIKLMLVITRRFSGKGDLPLRPAFQIAKERIANRRGIKARG